MKKMKTITFQDGDTYEIVDDYARGLLSNKTEKTRIDYKGAKEFRVGTKILNFADLYNYHITKPDFTYIVYGDRAYLCSFVNNNASLREMRFESVINSDSRTKVSSIYVTSTDGQNITNVTVSDINSENSSNKVSEITDTIKSSAGYYPSVKAMVDYIDKRLSNPNLLDNPDGRINQRGFSTYTQPSNTAGTTTKISDRWYHWTGTAGNKVSINTEKKIRLDSPSVGANRIGQFIDPDKIPTEGTTVTLSVRYASTTPCSVFYGPGDHYLFTIPSNAGDAIATHTFQWPGGVAQIFMQISMQGAFVMRDAKLEIGSISTLTKNEYHDHAAELLNCQRFYYQSWTGSVADIPQHGAKGASFATTHSSSLGNHPAAVQFPVKMREIPGVVLYSYVDGAAGQVVDWDLGGNISAQASYINLDKFSTVACNLGRTGGNVMFHYSASADLG